MRTNITTRLRRGSGRWRSPLLAAALAAGLAGCDSLLEVDNPNNVLQDDLQDPGSVNAVVNGAESATARAVGDALLGHITLTDEYDWVGSWNAAGELERGEMANPANDFMNVPFQDLSIARWLSDEAIELAEEYRGELPQPKDLARAYYYSGVTYMTIADMFDDFVIGSDRTEEAPPVGEANMVQVYDIAIERLTSALTEARAMGDVELERSALAMRARTHWGKALWQKLNPAGSTPGDPLIDDAAANQDAMALLALIPENPDWRAVMTFSPQTIDNRAASWANSRLEVRVGTRFGVPTESDKQLAELTYEDPIDEIVDPALASRVNEFIDGFQTSPVTLVSARELRLILAEAALASGQSAEAVEYINDVRALDGLTPYDPDVHALTPLEMLKHERLVNLFLMVQRRLGDMYRFGEVADEWIPGSEALTRPGSFFIIGEEERLSNCHILGTCSGG